MTDPGTASLDAAPLGDGRLAVAVERPASLDDLADAVARRVAEGLAIYPQGGRTALDYGRPPGREGVAVDTTALRRVVDYPAADMTITVESGTTLAELQQTLASQGQRLPLEAPQPDRATLGGIFATDTCGPRRLGSGRPRDLILGVGFVDASGALVRGGGRVVKNVAGYDLPKLLTGSLGTLGILAELTLKVRPKPESYAIAWAVFESPDSLATALTTLNTSATRPAAIELLSPGAAGRIGGPLDLPSNGWALAIGFEGSTEAVAWQLDRSRDELGRPAELTTVDGPGADRLWNALTGFQAAEVGPLTLKVNIPLHDVAPFARTLDASGWLVQAHAGSGVLWAQREGDPDLEAIAAEVDTLRASAVATGGNLTVPRCPTDWKDRLEVWGAPRPDWALAERVKQALDPRGVMNPGRFVGTI